MKKILFIKIITNNILFSETNLINNVILSQEKLKKILPNNYKPNRNEIAVYVHNLLYKKQKLFIKIFFCLLISCLNLGLLAYIFFTTNFSNFSTKYQYLIDLLVYEQLNEIIKLINKKEIFITFIFYIIMFLVFIFLYYLSSPYTINSKIINYNNENFYTMIDEFNSINKFLDFCNKGAISIALKAKYIKELKRMDKIQYHYEYNKLSYLLDNNNFFYRLSSMIGLSFIIPLIIFFSCFFKKDTSYMDSKKYFTIQKTILLITLCIIIIFCIILLCFFIYKDFNLGFVNLSTNKRQIDIMKQLEKNHSLFIKLVNEFFYINNNINNIDIKYNKLTKQYYLDVVKFIK
jgi:hypothetical protein